MLDFGRVYLHKPWHQNPESLGTKQPLTLGIEANQLDNTVEEIRHSQLRLVVFLAFSSKGFEQHPFPMVVFGISEATFQDFPGIKIHHLSLQRILWVVGRGAYHFVVDTRVLEVISLKRGIHPGRLTWNIIMEVWKIIFLSKWVICRFHVNLPGCMWSFFFPGYSHLKNGDCSHCQTQKGFECLIYKVAATSSFRLYHSLCLSGRVEIPVHNALHTAYVRWVRNSILSWHV